ncbi:trypsin-like peptidase domain-containing protein [Aureimonas sp. Leaf324]|uniref:trypsin-like peptidase domain-containing protein n=1 Tax=Aureimonas sp. Leaf324 TaxID=1736336 RepID=UPI0009EB9A4C
MRRPRRPPVSPFLVAGLASLVVAASTPVAAYADVTSRSRSDVVATLLPAIVTVVAEGVTARTPPADALDGVRSIAAGSSDRRRLSSLTQPMEDDTGTSIGTGFILTKDGAVVTSEHVVHQAERITIRTADGRSMSAELVGSDAVRDVAVLRIDPVPPLPHVEWGKSEALRIGDEVLVFGNTFGLGIATSLGMVSALDRDLGMGPLDDFIQIDAALNSGDSGGPIIDGDGRVVGIDTAIYSPTGVSAGVGFAIPSDDARKVIDAILRGKPPRYGHIGIRISDVSDEVRDALGLERSEGALVLGVGRDSPASKAGLRASDVLVSLDGSTVANARELARHIAARAPDTVVPVEVLRAGRRLRLSVTVAQSDDQASPSGVGNRDALELTRFGLSIEDSPTGVEVTDVVTGGSAESIGIVPGDLIVSINQLPVANTARLSQIVDEAAAAARPAIVIAVRRGQEEDVATLPLDE